MIKTLRILGNIEGCFLSSSSRGSHADEIFFRSSTRSESCWYGTRSPLFGLLLPSCNKYEKIWMEPKIWNLSFCCHSYSVWEPL